MVGRPNRSYAFAVVVCARWETDHIQEWLAYHHRVGFEHFYLYSNDDRPNELFEIVRSIQIFNPGLITYNHCQLQGAQREMYLHFWENYGDEVDWVIFLDVDEFLNLSGRAIRDVVGEADPSCSSIYFNWLMFGNNGFKTRPSGSTLLNYTQRQETIHPYTKNLVRSAAVDVERLRLSNHTGFWHGWEHRGSKDVLRPNWQKTLNVLGDSMDLYYADFPQSAYDYLALTGEKLLQKPRIHHYSMRSEADFLLREARGLGGAFHGQRHWGNIFRDGTHLDHLRQLSVVSDDSLATFWRDELTFEGVSI